MSTYQQTKLRDKDGNVLLPETIAAAVSDSARGKTIAEVNDSHEQAICTDTFSTSNNYDAGEKVWYQGTLYQFRVPHSGAWSASDVVPYNVVDHVDEAESDVTALTSALESETTARTNADTALGNRIGAEELTRANADTALQGNIDAEATTRENADTALQQSITSEASLRSSADTTLQNNISAEATTRANADTALDTAKADKVAAVIEGHLAGLDEYGNLTDSGSGIDATPTEGSENVVKSKGVYSALASETNSREDADTTLQGNIDQLESGITDGTIIAALAEDLNISTNAAVECTQTNFIETAGGSESIKTGTAQLVAFRGTEDGIVASGAKITGTGFNQIPTTGVSGQTATFPVVASQWGEYGSAAENNGYLFTDSDGNIVVPSSVTQNNSAVPTHIYNGVTYYLPSYNGTMVATFASGVDVSAICGHICWSNYRDTEYAVYEASVIDISSIITTMGGTLRRIVDGSKYIYDVITFGTTSAERTYTNRIGVATLASLTWTVESETTDTNTTYTFSATISAMKSDGLFSIKDSNLTNDFVVDGTTLKYSTTDISTVSAFIAAVAGITMWYQFATEITGTHSVAGTFSSVDDFGTIIFGQSVDVDMDLQFTAYWKDTLKNLPDVIAEKEEIAAEALDNLDRRLQAIEDMVANGFPQLKVNGRFDGRIRKGSIMLKAAGAPSADVAPDDWDSETYGDWSGIPLFEGQAYLDTTNKVWYKATGISAVTDWKQITNA